MEAMAFTDHNPYQTPGPSAPAARKSNPIRYWLDHLTGWQLFLFSVGCGLFAFSIFSLVTAGLLRQQFLTENLNDLTVTELFAVPLQGLAAAFLGACCIFSSWQQRD